jgi:hypothetical protein
VVGQRRKRWEWELDGRQYCSHDVV